MESTILHTPTQKQIISDSFEIEDSEITNGIYLIAIVDLSSVVTQRFKIIIE